MNFKKLLKGPAVWIILAAFIFMLGSSLSSGSEFKQVDTSKGLSLIADGKASAVKVYEGEKRVDVTLKSADAELGKKVQFYFVYSRGQQVVDAIADANLTDGYNDENPNTPWYISLLSTIFPFIIIGAIFWFLMSGAQGGNSRVMNFGKSRAKLVNKQDSKVTELLVSSSMRARLLPKLKAPPLPPPCI